MAQPNEAYPLRHIFVTGSSGSGKTTWVMREPLVIDAPRRLLWDPDGSHARGPRPATTITDWREYVIAVQRGLNRGGRVNLAYAGQQTEEAFQRWCDLVWRLSRDPKVPPLAAVIEEVAHVTSTAKARGAHFEMLTRGRKYGLMVVSIAQRAAEVDKTTVGNRGVIVCGALDRRQDRERMADELDIDADQIAELATLNEPGRKVHLYVRRAGGLAQRQMIAFRKAS